MSWNQFIGITVLIYALTNPVGAIPIFLGLTRQAGSVKTHRIIILACTAVAIFFCRLRSPRQGNLGFLQCWPG
jgi:small neutral amino acid transporter SnatA (MarC family)